MIDEVLLHGSGANSPLVLTLVPHQLAPWVLENRLALLLSLVFLIPVGLLFRRLPPFEMALVYTVAALLFAWGVANQYLLIPVAAVGSSLTSVSLVVFGRERLSRRRSASRWAFSSLR